MIAIRVAFTDGGIAFVPGFADKSPPIAITGIALRAAGRDSRHVGIAIIIRGSSIDCDANRVAKSVDFTADFFIRVQFLFFALFSALLVV